MWAWTIKVTEEYAAWFTALIEDDLASAVQVAQAVAAPGKCRKPP
jgi:hypothetical protein